MDVLPFSRLVHIITSYHFIPKQTRYFIIPISPLWITSALSALFIYIMVSVYIQEGSAVIFFSLVESQAPHQTLLSQGNLLYQLTQNPVDQITHNLFSPFR